MQIWNQEHSQGFSNLNFSNLKYTNCLYFMQSSNFTTLYAHKQNHGFQLYYEKGEKQFILTIRHHVKE